MRTLPGYEWAKAVLGTFSLQEFEWLRAMHLDTYTICGDARCRLRVELRMECTSRSPPCTMVLRFEDVRGLKVPGFDSGSIQVPGFDIVDIAERGWEGIRWVVKDYEEAQLRFYSRSAAIVCVAPTARIGLGNSGAEDADDLK